jgi:hypothetical protein
MGGGILLREIAENTLVEIRFALLANNNEWQVPAE